MSRMQDTIDRLMDLEKKVDGIDSKIQAALILPVEYHRFYCANCGNPFILNGNQFKRRLDKNKEFYCASGHINVFSN